jgi:hypothetical protein
MGMRDMPDKLSEQMRRAIEAIRAQGGFAIPEGGGWWQGGDGKRLRHQNVTLGGDYTEPVVTRTIYALERRGLLQRRRFRKEAWKDTYAAVSGECMS